MSNILLFAGNGVPRRLANAHISRVINAGGVVQSTSYVYDHYKLVHDLRLTGQIRHHYNALGGVLLNNVSGTNFVQTMFNMGSLTSVDATQGTSANQPLWDTDADLPAGIRAPRFNGSNNFIPVNDLAIFNGQAAGTLIAVAKDTNRTGGDASHRPVFVSALSATSVRAAISTRGAGGNNFAAGARRLDGDSAVSSFTASIDGFSHLTALFVWGGNIIELVANGVNAPTSTYSSGGGITSATNSGAFNIGAIGAASDRFPGLITSVTAGRLVLTAQQINLFRQLERAYYPSLPA